MVNKIKKAIHYIRLKLALAWHTTVNRVRNIKRPAILRSRAALMLVYLLVVAGLTTVWWLNSPYREQFEPPIVQNPVEDPPEAPADVVTETPEPPAQPVVEVPVTPPPIEEPAMPVVAPVVNITSVRKPVEGAVVMAYGFIEWKTYGDFRWHDGVGLASTQGTPVVAAYAGRVLQIVSNDPLWGRVVILDHGSGWHTKYANLSAVSLSVGQTVAEGQQIGQVGPNPPCKASDSPQLHFELLKDGESVDPTAYFR